MTLLEPAQSLRHLLIEKFWVQEPEPRLQVKPAPCRAGLRVTELVEKDLRMQNIGAFMPE